MWFYFHNVICYDHLSCLKARFRKEMDFERMKVIGEWQKIAAERKKISSTGLTTHASPDKSPPKNAKDVDGLIACQDVRLMSKKANMEVWKEVGSLR